MLVRQAMVPRGATVIENSRGTAPGLWIEREGTSLALLPGPPRELQPMFERSVRPALAARTAGRRVWRRVLKIVGRPESHVEEIANPIYSKMADGDVPISTTILASPGVIELHLSARGDDQKAIEDALDRGVQTLAAALGLAGCGQAGTSSNGSTNTFKGVPLVGAGATFPAPVYAQWAQSFNKIEAGGQVNYQAIGSGGGEKQGEQEPYRLRCCVLQRHDKIFQHISPRHLHGTAALPPLGGQQGVVRDEATYACISFVSVTPPETKPMPRPFVKTAIPGGVILAATSW